MLYMILGLREQKKHVFSIDYIIYISNSINICVYTRHRFKLFIMQLVLLINMKGSMEELFKSHFQHFE